MTHALQTYKTIADCPVFRIKAGESNKFVVLIDPLTDPTSFVQVVEIFDVGGSTPPNQHRAADEVFFVLHGEGEASTADGSFALRAGTTLLLRPGVEHAVRNTGSVRLYCLTTMVPDENFAKLITEGVPDTLDALDMAVLAKS
jgi:mannose-6-phosphate isomerase-like protein (cupin superfamily)